MIAVRQATPNEAAALGDIVRSLPAYFTEDVPDTVAADFLAHGAWLAVDTGAVDVPLGFTIVERRSRDAAEILWMAVHAHHRSRGVGTLLLDRVLDDLAASGTRLIEVKTLDTAAGYEPYEATRAFWERRGFIKLDVIDPLPGWQPGNPAAIYVAVIGDPTGRSSPCGPPGGERRAPGPGPRSR